VLADYYAELHVCIAAACEYDEVRGVRRFALQAELPAPLLLDSARVGVLVWGEMWRCSGKY
jgi:hypothetical protein